MHVIFARWSALETKVPYQQKGYCNAMCSLHFLQWLAGVPEPWPKRTTFKLDNMVSFPHLIPSLVLEKEINNRIYFYFLLNRMGGRQGLRPWLSSVSFFMTFWNFFPRSWKSCGFPCRHAMQRLHELSNYALKIFPFCEVLKTSSFTDQYQSNFLQQTVFVFQVPKRFIFQVPSSYAKRPYISTNVDFCFTNI